MISGLPQLNNIIKEKGEDFVYHLLNEYVIISEKLWGSRLSFQKVGEKLWIFKKDEKYAISIIDRTLAQYYEKAIQHLDDILRKVEIPSNYRFGCEYFANKKPANKYYENLPKGNLVLTDIKIYDEFNKIEQTIINKQELDKWANILEIQGPPIIFEGKLDNIQKSNIIEYCKSSVNDIENKFNNIEFTKYILNILNPDYVNDDFDQIIFKFLLQDNKIFSAKIIDSLIKNNIELNVNSIDNRVPGDMYSITLMDIHNFILQRGFKGIKLKEKSVDFRYIELISILFNDFINVYGTRYKDVDFNVPEFMNSPEFKMNLQFIENTKTLEILKTNSSYQELFKIFLASLKKKKKKVYGLLNTQIISEINLIIDKIREFVEGPLNENLMTFTDFKLFFEESDEQNSNNDLDDKSNIEIDNVNLSKNLKDILILDFEILTLDILESIKLLNLNTIDLYWYNKNSKIPKSLIESQIEILSNILQISINHYGEFNQFINYDNVNCIYIDSTLYDEISLEIEWLIKNGINLHEIQIHKLLINHIENEIFKIIEIDDFSKFKHRVPREIYSLYYDFKKSLISNIIDSY